MRRVLDVENSITLRDGKIFNDPYEPANTLTEVGVLCLDTGEKRLLPFDHKEATEQHKSNACVLQRRLDNTTLLIGHNLQYDLAWLWANDFKYSGDIYDTMLAEYLLLRGQKQPLSLEQCAIRRELQYQKMIHSRRTTRKDTIPMRYHLMNSAIILTLICLPLASCTKQLKQTSTVLTLPLYKQSKASPLEPAKSSQGCQWQESGWIEMPSKTSVINSSESATKYLIDCKPQQGN